MPYGTQAEDLGITNMGLDMKPSKVEAPSYLTTSQKQNDNAGSAFFSLDEQYQDREVHIWKKAITSCHRLIPFIICVLVIGFVTALGLFLWQVTVSEKDAKSLTDIGPLPYKEICHQYPQLVKYAKIQQTISSKFRTMADKVDEIYKKHDYKAVSIGVIYNGETIWTSNIGRLNYSEKNSNAINDKTLYPVASITKVITAIMLQSLIADGLVSADTRLERLEPQLKWSSLAANNVTLRQLACMISGLKREAPCVPATKSNLCPFNYSEMIRRTSLQSIIMKPNRYTSYSNLGYALLGQILARKVSNNSYEEYVIRRIFKPLGMRGSTFSHKRRNKYPASINPDGTPSVIPDWGWLSPAGGASLSLRDTLEMTKFLLKSSYKSYLSESFINLLMKPERFTPDGMGCGCPFQSTMINLPHKEYGYRAYYKDGVIYGYGSIIGLVPQLKLGINVLTAGKASSAYPIYSQIFRQIISNFHETLKVLDQKRYKLPSDATKYVGKYKLDTYWPLVRDPVEITMEDNILYLKMEWFKGPLSYVQNRTLETVDYAKLKVYCSIRSLGVIKEKYYFDESTSVEAKYPGFRVNGISLSGFAHFSRIPGY